MTKKMTKETKLIKAQNRTKNQQFARVELIENVIENDSEDYANASASAIAIENENDSEDYANASASAIAIESKKTQFNSTLENAKNLASLFAQSQSKARQFIHSKKIVNVETKKTVSSDMRQAIISCIKDNFNVKQTVDTVCSHFTSLKRTTCTSQYARLKSLRNAIENDAANDYARYYKLIKADSLLLELAKMSKTKDVQRILQANNVHAQYNMLQTVVTCAKFFDSDFINS